MKFKTSAIALAVAGSIAAPMAVQAEGSVYASARVGLVVSQADGGDVFTVKGVAPLTGTTASTDDFDTTEIRSMASRFGAKGETDLGNGMTGFGRYEWDVDMTSGESPKTRHRYVGVKGDFGSVQMGQSYGAFYNHTVGPVDNPWWGSGYAMVAYVGREDNQLSYSGSAGAISFGVTLIMFEDSEEEDIDWVEAGVTIPVGDTNLGFAFRQWQGDDDPATNLDEEDAILSATWSGISLGEVGLGFNVQQQDEDMSFLIEALMSNFYLHIEALSIDEDGLGDDRDRLSTTLGYTQSLGRNTTMWYEIQVVDNDDNVALDDADGSGTISVGDSAEEAGDLTVLRAILKYDIL